MYNKTVLFPLRNPSLTYLKPSKVTPLCFNVVIKTLRTLFAKCNGNVNIVLCGVLLFLKLSVFVFSSLVCVAG